MSALLVLTSAAACEAGSSPVSCDDPVVTTEVEMVDFDYIPRCIGAEPGDTLSIRNTGETPHTFTVRGVDLEVNVGAGGSADLVLAGVAAATTYEVICTIHPQQMVAALAIS